jgi:hypothetical protein
LQYWSGTKDTKVAILEFASMTRASQVISREPLLLRLIRALRRQLHAGLGGKQSLLLDSFTAAAASMLLGWRREIVGEKVNSPGKLLTNWF